MDYLEVRIVRQRVEPLTNMVVAISDRYAANEQVTVPNSLYLNIGWKICTRWFNPLPNNKISDWSKLKQIADILKCI